MVNLASFSLSCAGLCLEYAGCCTSMGIYIVCVFGGGFFLNVDESCLKAVNQKNQTIKNTFCEGYA